MRRWAIQAEVVRVRTDAELLLDQVGDAASPPQLVGARLRRGNKRRPRERS
jgi:hypothetical protein